MRRTERAAYRTKFYSNLSSPTRFDEEPKIFLCFCYKSATVVPSPKIASQSPVKSVTAWAIDGIANAC